MKTKTTAWTSPCNLGETTPYPNPNCVSGCECTPAKAKAQTYPIGKFTFSTCTGFYEADVCPSMMITIGAATGYMGICSTLFVSLYNVIAGQCDPVEDEDGVGGEPASSEAVVVVAVQDLGVPASEAGVTSRRAGNVEAAIS